jgi:hypothetical protein
MMMKQHSHDQIFKIAVRNCSVCGKSSRGSGHKIRIRVKKLRRHNEAKQQQPSLARTTLVNISANINQAPPVQDAGARRLKSALSRPEGASASTMKVCWVPAANNLRT